MSTTSLQDIKSVRFWLALLAEFLGTFLLVVVACGSCDTGDVVRISLAFGLSVATIVWAIGHVSGGHINPAVTVGFLVTRKISILRAFLYVVVQSVGAIAGAGILKVLRDLDKDSLCTSQPAIAGGMSLGQIFGYEFIITFVLVFTVFATCDSLRSGFNGSGPLAIGLSIAMCHLWAADKEGAGMNPARVLGPAVVSDFFEDVDDSYGIHAMYWIGPLVAGLVAGLLYDLVFAANASVAKAKAFFTKRDYNDAQFGIPEQSLTKVGAAELA